MTVGRDRRLCQSRRVKSCGPSGSQDLALLRSRGGDPLPFLVGVNPYHGLLAATGRNPQQRFSPI
jgi:hypothetical protein